MAQDELVVAVDVNVTDWDKVRALIHDGRERAVLHAHADALEEAARRVASIADKYPPTSDLRIAIRVDVLNCVGDLVGAANLLRAEAGR